MADRPDGLFGLAPRTRAPRNHRRDLRGMLAMFAFLAVTLLLATHVSAQAGPHVTGVDPTSGKVNDTVTVSGENLGKDGVAAVFLSDDKSDFKATIVEQAADKIIVKVPQVKPGGYNFSIQVGDNILILPVRFTVSE